MDYVAKSKHFVENECKKPSSKYGYEPFEFHFVPVVKYASGLAKEMGADTEIVEIAGWLHDVGSIIVGREDHHVTGAKIAKERLAEWGFPANRTQKVVNCILNHRGSRNDKRETLEEKIVAEADTMSNFDNVSGILKAAFVYENLNQKDAAVATLKKLKNKYEQLHFERSREIIKPKYEAAKLLLKD